MSPLPMPDAYRTSSVRILDTARPKRPKCSKVSNCLCQKYIPSSIHPSQCLNKKATPAHTTMTFKLLLLIAFAALTATALRPMQQFTKLRSKTSKEVINVGREDLPGVFFDTVFDPLSLSKGLGPRDLKLVCLDPYKFLLKSSTPSHFSFSRSTPS